MEPRGLVLYISQLRATLLTLFFWHSGDLVQSMSGGMYDRDLAVALLEIWGEPGAPFAQTAVSRGLDCSTALPVPAANFLCLLGLLAHRHILQIWNSSKKYVVPKSAKNGQS